MTYAGPSHWIDSQGRPNWKMDDKDYCACCDQEYVHEKHLPSCTYWRFTNWDGTPTGRKFDRFGRFEIIGGEWFCAKESYYEGPLACPAV
jgi:hypothetical protein